MITVEKKNDHFYIMKSDKDCFLEIDDCLVIDYMNDNESIEGIIETNIKIDEDPELRC